MTSAYPDIEGQLYTTGPVDAPYTEAEARQRAADRREVEAAASAAGASALADAKAYTDQKVTGLATTVAMNAADALTLSNAKTYTDAQLAEFDSFVGVPIFETLAEAEAWEAANPGKKALTLEASTPDTTPPTWNATLTVGTPTDTQVVATASTLATDDRAVAGYEVTYNGTTWAGITPTGRDFTLTGTAETTYSSTRLRAKDAAGNASAPLSVPSYTMAETPVGPTLPWMPAGAQVVLSDTFSGGDRTSFTGYVPDNALGGTLTPAPYLSVEDAFRIEGGHLVATATGRFLYDVGATAGDGKGWYASFRLVEVPTEGTAARSLRLRTGIVEGGSGNEVAHGPGTGAHEYGVHMAADGTLTTYLDGQPGGTSAGSISGPYTGLVSINITRAVISQIVIAEVPA